MELNTEQIKKALELCTTTDDCVGCPYLIKRGDGAILPCTIDADALALIKQLAEENERLRVPTYMLREDGGVELMPTIESVRADTVREMQEKVLQLFPADKNFTTISRFSINQIAKEMLEGDDA